MKRFLLVIPIFLVMLLGACDSSKGGFDPSIITFFVQTQTATMWTPAPIKPSATHIPKESLIVNALNDELRKNANALDEALDAKFSVMDVGFQVSGNPALTTTIIIQVKCESATNFPCAGERAFVALVHVFEKASVRKKINEQIPTTINVLQVKAFDHLMKQTAIIEASWRDLLSYTNGSITGEQLAARTNRFPSLP